MLDKSKSFCKKYIASQLYTKEFLLTASNIIVIKKIMSGSNKGIPSFR